MAQLRIRLSVGILAFTIGLLCHLGRVSLRQRSSPSQGGIERTERISNTFVWTGNFNFSKMRADYLRASDGAYVQFGCHVRSSDEVALRFVRGDRAAGVLKTSMVLSDEGTKLGERVVWESSDKSEAQVEWSEGSRWFYISGRSLRDVLSFEQSRVWTTQSCWDLSFLDAPPPNKRLERTRR